MTNLIDFMNNGISNIADAAGRFYTNSLRGQSFMLKAASSLRKSAKIRKQNEAVGINVPPFLIASITASCNLRCSGCYAWANGGCGDGRAQEDMSLENWRSVFRQASEMGVSFILLAGGEPLLRWEIIEMAADFENMFFPVFTNGTIIDDEYISFFEKHRNLIPVLSIEGDDTKTDARRGSGVSDKIRQVTQALYAKGILFGASITVTSENMGEVTNKDFVSEIRESGCGLVFFVEYVPAESGTEHLILSDDAMRELQSRVDLLRNDKANKGIIFLSFPGDEAAMGGCLAAGRGFFHINAAGGAEPCPFSPYSMMNLKEESLIEVLQSDFFEEVRGISAASALNHKGGCTLFQHKEEVEIRLSSV